MEGFTLIIALAALILAIVLILAPLKLFSIDRTLKEIRDELRAAREIESARAVSANKELQVGVPRQAGVPRALG